MNDKLFTNSVTINAKAAAARQILTNPSQLVKWVPEINAVDQSRDSFIITRSQEALNQVEVITVELTDSTIIYHSRQGRLNYDLVFTLLESDNHLQIQEELIIDDSETKLPLKLLAPIAKHALNVNLINLGRLIEGITMV